MKKFEIWCEGFSVTGNIGKAFLMDIVEAESFDEAVKKYSESHGNSIDMNRFGAGRHSNWGCEPFDNEADARKSFG